MLGSGSYTVTDPVTYNKLKMTISYDGTFPVELISFYAEQSLKTLFFTGLLQRNLIIMVFMLRDLHPGQFIWVIAMY